MSSLKKDIQDLLRKEDAVELVEYELSDALKKQRVVPNMYPRLTAQTINQILNLIESVIPEEKEFGTGKYSDYGEGFNDCIKDIKSKLIEGEK